MQNSAISFSISVNDHEDRVARFAKALEAEFTCEIIRGLELITVRHADDFIIEQQRKGKMQYMNERVGKTVQMVLGKMQVPVRK